MVMTIVSIVMWLIAVFIAAVTGALAERGARDSGRFWILGMALFIILGVATQLSAVIQATS